MTPDFFQQALIVAVFQRSRAQVIAHLPLNRPDPNGTRLSMPRHTSVVA
jgi:hypothetical protein